MIQLLNASKIYKSKLSYPIVGFKNVSISIEKEESVCIVGKSGSGKSTLLDVFATLQKVTHGEHLYNARSINSYSQSELARLRNSEMGFVFQSFNLINKWSVKDNIELPLRYSSNKKVGKSRFKLLIDKLDLNSLLNRRPDEISGGQRQRVAVARALINDPSFIFADEPTGSLDSVASEMVIELLLELNNQGKSIIMVTHDQGLSGMFNRIINVTDGCVSEQ